MSRMYARVKDASSGLFEFAAADRAGRNVEILLLDGFLPVVEEPADEVTLAEFQRFKPMFRVESDQIVKYYQIEESVAELIQKRIDEIQESLAQSDYKILKCYECAIVGEVAGYDAQELHLEREALRGEIRELKERIE